MRLASAMTPHPLREDAEGIIRIGGTRVTLQTVIAAYDEGAGSVPERVGIGRDVEQRQAGDLAARRVGQSRADAVGWLVEPLPLDVLTDEDRVALALEREHGARRRHHAAPIDVREPRHPDRAERRRDREPVVAVPAHLHVEDAPAGAFQRDLGGATRQRREERREQRAADGEQRGEK